MNAADAAWHLFGRIILFGFTVVVLLVVSYIAQENEARDTVRTRCVTSWDCTTGQRVAPKPDTANMPNNDIPVERTR